MNRLLCASVFVVAMMAVSLAQQAQTPVPPVVRFAGTLPQVGQTVAVTAGRRPGVRLRRSPPTPAVAIRFCLAPRGQTGCPPRSSRAAPRDGSG